jgi:hypothetical protein
MVSTFAENLLVNGHNGGDLYGVNVGYFKVVTTVLSIGSSRRKTSLLEKQYIIHKIENKQCHVKRMST